MLELKNIKKDYPAGGGVVHALKGIDLSFRKSEFVSILGQSGCGKTTMLNIIGGLDSYTDGDLIINGTSTKEYKDRDWDSYRNHSIGFVFQSYNLIPHQTVLQNVELALTLSGEKKENRRKKAIKALEQVGLGDQLNKKPSEMSGGQMQRVAIARAIVNNPDIILADEPTGALDTETSVQVMEVLKNISNERLVIMVTHNPELANRYSSRIIKMVDGVVKEDSAPLSNEEIIEETKYCESIKQQNSDKKIKKPSMSFFTSFMLSLKNLFTKKGRTILTAFAGSIGIIGIALILAVSQGMTAYISHVQETTLTSYPMTIEQQNIDISSLMHSFSQAGSNRDHENDAIYKDPVISDLVDALSKLQVSKNDLGAFKKKIEEDLKSENSVLKNILTGIQYTYQITPTIYTKNIDGEIIKSDMNELFTKMMSDFMLKASQNENFSGSNSGLFDNGSTIGASMMGQMMGLDMWQELLPGLNGEPINDIIKQQYDMVYGTWPTEKNQIVLVLDKNNELNDLALYALGLISKSEIEEIIDASASGRPLSGTGTKSWSYETILNMKYKTILPYDCYSKNSDGIFVDNTKDELTFSKLYNEALELEVVGIIRPNKNSSSSMISGSICYTNKLTKYFIESAYNSEVVKAQLANPTIDVLTGKPFESNTKNYTPQQKQQAFINYISNLDVTQKRNVYIEIQSLEAINSQLESQVNDYLDSITDKDSLIDMIINNAGDSFTGEIDEIKIYLQSLSLSELKSMIKPYIEKMVQNQITEQVKNSYESFNDQEIANMLDNELLTYSIEKCVLYYDNVTDFSESTYEKNLITIGCVDINIPSSINIYVASFNNKDIVADFINSYNSSVDESQKISYTDYLGIMMSSITTIINAITYVLIAFVAISLVVSSIMIGVITLISVQERTKEIGILRAIGASKKDVSSMFNAETMIIGLASGLLGVVVTYLLCIPINIILHLITGIANLNAILPVIPALVLIAISVILTLISGLIPSKSAAKKDPVVALRSE